MKWSYANIYKTTVNIKTFEQGNINVGKWENREIEWIQCLCCYFFFCVFMCVNECLKRMKNSFELLNVDNCLLCTISYETEFSANILCVVYGKGAKCVYLLNHMLMFRCSFWLSSRMPVSTSSLSC